MKRRTALVVGATGLVGSHVLRLLLNDSRWTRVLALTRRPLAISHPRLTNIVTDFEKLDKVARRLKADDVFCCLGTTLREAGGRAGFHKVDYGYAMAVARLTQENHAHHFLLLSAQGADARSLFFYNTVKGRLENDVLALNFEHLTVLRPSLILGQRPQRRWSEQLAGKILGAISPLLRGPLVPLRPVAYEALAAAMVQAAVDTAKTHHDVLIFKRIMEYASQNRPLLSKT